MISRIMTVHIWKTKIFIILVSKFKGYLLENGHFHIIVYEINIESYLILFYHFFVSILQSCPSLTVLLYWLLVSEVLNFYLSLI